MTIRKVQITWGITDHLRKEPWTDIRKTRRHELIDKLEALYGFRTTGVVRSALAIIGWLDTYHFEAVRALPEVVMLSDDYPYLMQENEMRPEWEMPHPYVVEAVLENKARITKKMRDRVEEKK